MQSFDQKNIDLDYDEDKDQLEEKQEEQTGKLDKQGEITTNQVF